MLRLALTTLRHRKAGFAGALIALSFAAALVGACGVLLETGLRGAISTERYAGTPMIVAGDQNAHVVKAKKGKRKIKSKPLAEHAWIPESAAGAVRRVPGVRAVVSELDFPAYLVVAGRTVPGPDGSPSIGHGWESAALTPFTLRTGRGPDAAGEIVIDAGLATRAGLRTGSSVTVRTNTAPARYRVVGVADVGAVAGVAGVVREVGAASAAGGTRGLGGQAAVFFSTAEARRLAGHPGQISALGVFPDRSIDTGEIKNRVGRAVSGTGAKVYTGDARGALEFLDASKARVMLISLAGVLSGTSLLVAILVVVGTFALAIQQRHRELALLRATAATPRQIRTMIGREAVIVGVVASVPGCAASVAIAAWSRARLVGAGAIPDNLEPALSPFPMIAAAGTTTIAAWVAARVAVRRAARIHPIEALAEAAVEPARPGAVRLFAGAAFLGGAIVLTAALSRLYTEPAAVPVTFLTSGVWVIAVALADPAVVRVATAVLSVPLRHLSPATGYLASLNVRAESRRLAAVVTPVTLAVTMTCTILFAQTTLGHASQRQVEQGILADYVLSASAPGVPAALADEVRGVPGVWAVTQVVHTTVRGPGLARYSTQGVTPDQLDRTLDMDVRAGSLADLRDDTAALSTTAASSAGVRLGDRLRLRLGDGTPVTVRVIAIYARGLGFGDVVLSHAVVAAHVDDPLDNSVLVRTAPGAKDRPLALERGVSGHPGVQILDRTDARARHTAQQRINAEVQYLVMGLVIGFTTIAAVNTLLMVTADRTREFALLRLVGTTRRQIRRMTRWESLVITVIGLVLGTMISLIVLSAFSSGMTRRPPYVPPIAYLGVIAATALVAVAATGPATRAALRYHPAEAIGSRR